MILTKSDELEYCIVRVERLQDGLQYWFGRSAHFDVKLLEGFKQKVTRLLGILRKFKMVYIGDETYELVKYLATVEGVDSGYVLRRLRG